MEMAPKRVSWSEKDMAEAVHAVINDILPISAAAAIYRIPKRTLRDYVKRHRLKRTRQPTPDKDPIDENQEADGEEKINNNTDAYVSFQLSWYCHACGEDTIADMRQCKKCVKWYHEVCVGLTSNDLDPFECPTGC